MRLKIDYKTIKKGFLTEDEWNALPKEVLTYWTTNYKKIKPELIGTALPNVKNPGLIW